MDIYIIFIIADNQICQALGGYLHNFDYNQIWRALGGYLIFLLLRIIIFIIIADKQICRALGGYLSKFLQRILEALRQRPHQVFVFNDDDDEALRQRHTSYLSRSSHVRHVEKNLSCGEISDIYTWPMGRNLINVAEFQI